MLIMIYYTERVVITNHDGKQKKVKTMSNRSFKIITVLILLGTCMIECGEKSIKILIDEASKTPIDRQFTISSNTAKSTFPTKEFVLILRSITKIPAQKEIIDTLDELITVDPANIVWKYLAPENAHSECNSLSIESSGIPTIPFKNPFGHNSEYGSFDGVSVWLSATGQIHIVYLRQLEGIARSLREMHGYDQLDSLDFTSLSKNTGFTLVTTFESPNNQWKLLMRATKSNDTTLVELSNEPLNATTLAWYQALFWRLCTKVIDNNGPLTTRALREKGYKRMEWLPHYIMPSMTAVIPDNTATPSHLETKAQPMLVIPRTPPSPYRNASTSKTITYLASKL